MVWYPFYLEACPYMSIYGNFTIYAENINILLLKLNATCSISIQFSLYFLLQRNIITRDSIV